MADLYGVVEERAGWG